jgi:hypothetical protein
MRQLTLLVMCASLAGCAHRTAQTKPAADAAEEAQGATPPAEEAPSATPNAADAPPPATAATAAAAPRPKIRIIVRSNPPKANVFWGKKALGPTPVILERPRDSGPVDLVVRSDGYFPVHTRAYTFRTDALSVRLTKVEDRLTLYGAKRDAESAPAVAEANAPAQPEAPPPASPQPAAAPAPQ